MGTPAFMPPEQFMGSVTEQTGDIYSLGVILFRLLTGRLPFEAPTIAALCHAHLRQRPPSLRNLDPGLPRHLETLVEMALDKNPNSRPRTAVHFKRLMHASDAPAVPGEMPVNPCDVPTLGSFGRLPEPEGSPGRVASSASAQVPLPVGATDAEVLEDAPRPGLWELASIAVLVAGFILSAYVHHRRLVRTPAWPEQRAGVAPGGVHI